MKRFFAAIMALAFAPSLMASFHFMQVEQVIGSIAGDNTAQAIQLRMSSAGQNIVSEARVRVWDAAGANPVLILNMASDVPVSAAGSRVLLCTPAFTAAMQQVVPGFAPDFTMTNAIPPSYLAAGRLTFESDAGAILWSIAWGGAAYTGSHAGGVTNDDDGNFGPAFGQGLPTTGWRAVSFLGASNAQSTTNAADYALSADPVSVTKNNGTSYVTNNIPQGGLLDRFDPDANDDANAVVIRADGRVLVGGKFTTVDGTSTGCLAQLHVDGSLDTAFAPNVNGDVKALAIQPDGKILVGGLFTTVASVPRNSIARLHANGTLDTTFNPNAPGGVETIAMQPDGKILIGGEFTTVGGVVRNRIARLNANGTLDTTFNPNADNFVLAITVQPDGRILVGGFFNTMGGVARHRVARLQADGSLDITFNPDANGTVRAFALQPDGKIVLGGAYTTLGGVTRNRLARLHADGSLDVTFNPDANEPVFATVLQADGKILVGSQFSQLGGVGRNNVARLNVDGSLDTAFDANANDVVFGIAVEANSNIIMVGRFTTMNGGVTRNRIARVSAPNGLLDGFAIGSAGMNAGIYTSTVQPDGNIIVGGEFTMVESTPRSRLARLKADGSIDTTFDPGADAAVRASALQADGKILVGGEFTNLASGTRNRIGRLLKTGALDSFDPNANGHVHAIAVQADGKILVGGAFTFIAGANRSRLARLNEDGTLDASFDPGAINSEVFTIAVQPDGDILIGGMFTSVGATGRNRIARVDGDDGSLATGFNPDAGGTVRTLVVRPDGRIVAGGAFTTMGATTRNRLALINADGTVDAGFNPDANTTVYALALQTDGGILVGGAFTGMSGTTRNRVARLNAGGILDQAFNPNANEAVYTLTLQNDGRLLVGGNFTTISAGNQGRLARLTNLAASESLQVDATETTITWARRGTSPEVDRITLESSTDQVSWTNLGEATRAGSQGDWELNGLTLPTRQNLFLRARGLQTQGGINGGDGSIHESVRLVFLGPEITVEQPVANVLTDGISAVDFGTVSKGAKGDRAFTIRNNSTVNLSGLSASIDGADAGSFTVLTAPAALLAPGGSTTFTVRFAPTTEGTRGAVLHIESDDVPGDPFDIQLGGTTPTTFVIDAPSFTVVESDGLISIPVRRVGLATTAVSVTLTTVAGTATTADYTPKTATVQFDAGETLDQVAIDITTDAFDEANHTFTVKLQSPSGGTLGTPSSAPVTILDPSRFADSTPPPTSTITAPLVNALIPVSAGGTVTVTGTATDTTGVQKVEARFVTSPPSAFTPAVLATPGATTTAYTVQLTPTLGGTNTVEVITTDYGSNASAVPATRSFIVTRPLLIAIAGTGTGTVSPAYSPTLFREVGKSYTVVATPSAASGIEPGSIFAGWTLGGVDLAQAGTPALTNANASRIGNAQANLIKQSLTFIFREGMTLTANFERNAYPARSGIYNGLVQTTTIEDGVSPTSTEGYFNAEIMTTGAFSGKLTIDGLVLNLSGLFDAVGVARFGTARTDEVVVTRTGKPSLKVKLNGPSSPPFKITGTVKQVGFQQSKVVGLSAVDADRAYYGKQILNGKVISKGVNTTVLQLASVDGRTLNDELVTGTGIPASATITTVNLIDNQITINKVVTAALNATPVLTFTRNVPDNYLTVPVSGAKTNGALTVVLPPKSPYYTQPGTFHADGDNTWAGSGGNYFDPGPNTEFRNGDRIRFIENAEPDDLPDALNDGGSFTVINREPNGGRFQISDGTSNTILVIEAGAGTVVRDPDNSQAEENAVYRWQDYPQGYGYGTATVTPAGVVSFTTTLADGTAATGSSTISEPVATGPAEDQHDGVVALFVPLYTKLGFLSGNVTLKNETDSDMLAVDVKWMRPAIATSHYFPAGWPSVISVGLKAAKFSVAPTTANKSTLRATGGLDIETSDPEGDGNAALSFGDGQLTESLLKNVMLSPTDVVVKVPDNDPTFTLTFAHTTGVLGGTFIHTNDTVPSIKGIIYQKGANAGGYGFFLTKQVVLDYTGESGWVELTGEGQ